jgi:hypothetical protein
LFEFFANYLLAAQIYLKTAFVKREILISKGFTQKESYPKGELPKRRVTQKQV